MVPLRWSSSWLRGSNTLQPSFGHGRTTKLFYFECRRARQAFRQKETIGIKRPVPLLLLPYTHYLYTQRHAHTPTHTPLINTQTRTGRPTVPQRNRNNYGFRTLTCAGPRSQASHAKLTRTCAGACRPVHEVCRPTCSRHCALCTAREVRAPGSCKAAACHNRSHPEERSDGKQVHHFWLTQGSDGTNRQANIFREKAGLAPRQASQCNRSAMKFMGNARGMLVRMQGNVRGFFAKQTPVSLPAFLPIRPRLVGPICTIPTRGDVAWLATATTTTKGPTS